MKSVRTKAKPSKRDAILNATLDVVVERGFHESPMSLIAERAGASAGVIYHHFESKEAILEAVYERVRALKRASLLDGYSPEMEAREAFIHVWTNGYLFYRKHQREMRFLELYESAGFACQPVKNAAQDKEAAALQRRFGPKSKGGALNELPGEVVHELTFGVVARLAKQQKALSKDVLRTVAEKMWEMVRATD